MYEVELRNISWRDRAGHFASCLVVMPQPSYFNNTRKLHCWCVRPRSAGILLIRRSLESSCQPFLVPPFPV